jgi:hypothetical protein
LTECSTSVLVLRQAVQHRQPILAFYDGSDAAQSALHVAAGLASLGATHPLTVFLPPQDEADTERLRTEVAEECENRVSQLQVRPLTETELYRIAALAQREGCGLFVMPGGASPLTDTSLQRFLHELDRPLLVVR